MQTPDPETPRAAVTLWPAIWSALAATAAAISSLFMVAIHRRNLLEASRPEMILADWSREQRKDVDLITINRLRNVGRGVALRVRVDAFKVNETNAPVAFMATKTFPLIAPNEAVDLGAEITVFWDNVPAGPSGVKFALFDVTVHAWDGRNFRHITTHAVFLSSPGNAATFSDFGPGIGGHRETRSTAVWILKIQAASRRAAERLRIARGRLLRWRTKTLKRLRR